MLVSRTTRVQPLVHTGQYVSCSASPWHDFVLSSIGALAELVDISCLYKNTELFDQLPDYAIDLWSKAPSSITTAKLISGLSILKSPVILGQHYFIPNPLTGSGVIAKWDFSSHLHNSSAVVVGAKTGDIAAPTGSKDIDWLSLSAVPGAGLLADQVFRTDTRLGQPPASVSLLLGA